MNFDRLKKINETKWYKNINVKPGQYIQVNEVIWEWNNRRIWKFKWIVLKVKKSKLADGTFTIRWKSAGVTIEKIYPLSFNWFEQVILLDQYKIRRAKLYYLRDKIGKQARLKTINPQNKGKNLIDE